MSDNSEGRDQTAADAAHKSAAEQSDPTTQMRPEEAQAKRSVRTGPIIWGVIVLAASVFAAQQVLAPASVDVRLWGIGLLIALGALLLVVAIVVMVRGRR